MMAKFFIDFKHFRGDQKKFLYCTGEEKPQNKFSSNWSQEQEIPTRSPHSCLKRHIASCHHLPNQRFPPQNPFEQSAQEPFGLTEQKALPQG
mmetsp:Transcript_26087/g.34246  ORF Transcript_26087/g.34246 Transcript_26087/m.34246 type:complete len:92 (+) Transcript_26087:258-533(+)